MNFCKSHNNLVGLERVIECTIHGFQNATHAEDL
jgi:hypothetical protein